jgi:hypothetical protein
MLIAESREDRMRVWIDGRVGSVTAIPYDINSPTFGSQVSALNYTPYYDDGDIVSVYGPSSMHPGGAHHLYADGSVHFLTDGISGPNYVALCTRAGGELIDDVD